MEYSTASGSESTQKWPQLSLREAGIDLIDCDHRTPSVCEAGFPYVAIPQLKEGHVDLADARLISADDFEDWTRKAKPQAHDVVLSRRCNPGETAYVPEGKTFAVGQNLVLLRSKGTKVYPPFLRWLTRGPEWWDQIEKYLNYGAVFDSLKCADVPNFTLTIPPLPEQRAIAHILGTLDDTIELNRRMNATLEAMARAIFRSWFVDFDPVRAKAEGREPAGMDAATAALFPDEFEESELGEIPKGWRVASLDEIADFLNGLALQNFRPQSDEEWLPVIKIAQLKDGVTTDCERARASIKPEYIIGNGDIIFSWSGSLEVVIWSGGRGALNQHLFKVTSSHFPKWFYYEWLLFHLDEFRSIAQDKATTMGHIKRHHLNDARVLIPSPELLDVMSIGMDALIEETISLKVQSHVLADLRDALLPRLLSGKTTIPP